MKKILYLITLAFFTTSFLSAQETSIKVISSPRAPEAIGPYSQAILAGNTLYLSGNIALDRETGDMDTLNMEKEVRRVMSNIKAILDEVGLSFENVVKSTIYTTDLGNYKLINDIYGEYFTKNPPARETVQVVALPKGAHVEISCIAVKF